MCLPSVARDLIIVVWWREQACAFDFGTWLAQIFVTVDWYMCWKPMNAFNFGASVVQQLAVVEF